jgi:hypothetical protein
MLDLHFFLNKKEDQAKKPGLLKGKNCKGV